MSDDKGKVQILIVLILLSLLFTGGVSYLFQKECAKNVSLQAELERVLEKQKLTEAKLQESQELVSGLETKLQEAKTEAETFTSQLEEEKRAKEEALGEIDQLKEDLEKQKNLKSSLETKVNKALADMNKLQAQLESLESQKTELQKKIKDLEDKVQATEQSAQTDEQGVELGKIVVNPEVSAPKLERAPAIIRGLEGKVLVVNKDYNFAVINLGSKDGVNIGDTFSLYHKEKYIGDLKVERIHDSMSAIAFTAELRDKINEGDKVARINK